MKMFPWEQVTKWVEQRADLNMALGDGLGWERRGKEERGGCGRVEGVE